jgi:hypothetical protein
VRVNHMPSGTRLLIVILGLATIPLGVAASDSASAVAHAHGRESQPTSRGRRTAIYREVSRRARCMSTKHGVDARGRTEKAARRRRRGSPAAHIPAGRCGPRISSPPALAAERDTQMSARASSAASLSAPFRFFSSSSFWNEPVAVDAALDPRSGELAGAFAALIAGEQRARSGPWINTISYSVPVYTVPADQPAVPVQLQHHLPDAALSSAWSAVPLPADARPAAGSDAPLVLWQPSTDRLWEFWRLVHEGDGWHASWGGAIRNASSNPGVYGQEAWPGAKPRWGVSATSLSLVGGLLSLEDLKKGQINHALSMAIPNARAGIYASPAQRDDGTSTNPLSLPEGAHLRLNPNLNLPALHLPTLTLMIAEAAQRYGIFITDRAANVTLYAQDPTPTGVNPYPGPNGYFEGKYPRELLASFPWTQLELLKMQLHTRS